MRALWFKGWMETRARLLVPFAMGLGFLLVYWIGHLAPSKTPDIFAFWMMGPVFLAGAGIKTESAGQVKGLHGSVLFTLGLPVSRMRLFATRTLVGLTEVAVLVAGVCCAIALTPMILGHVTASDYVRYGFAVFATSCAYYSFTTLLTTFVGQQWTFLAVVLLVIPNALSTKFPAALNFFGPTRSPLMTHPFPWSSTFFALGLATLFMICTTIVVKKKEY